VVFKDDIIHAQYGSGTAFFSSLLNAKKKIVSIRGSDWYILRKVGSFKERLWSRISHILTLVSLKKFDVIIVMSQRMKFDLIKTNPELEFKIRVLTDGIDLDLFYPIDKKFSKKKLGIESSKFLVGIGSVDEHNSIKRISIVRKAVELLSQNYPIELFLLTNIEHSQMNYYLNCCDVVVLTSVYEGWPNIIKEGLACNVPFISTDVSDLGLIAFDSSSGCKITSDSVEDVALSIQQMYFDIKSGKTWDTRKFVLPFDLNQAVASLISLYN
jgi:glycosyltransferase involved in cell wall biosynthesis